MVARKEGQGERGGRKKVEKRESGEGREGKEREGRPKERESENTHGLIVGLSPHFFFFTPTGS